MLRGRGRVSYVYDDDDGDWGWMGKNSNSFPVSVDFVLEKRFFIFLFLYTSRAPYHQSFYFHRTPGKRWSLRKPISERKEPFHYIPPFKLMKMRWNWLTGRAEWLNDVRLWNSHPTLRSNEYPANGGSRVPAGVINGARNRRYDDEIG